MNDLVRIAPKDLVAVALRPLKAGETVSITGKARLSAKPAKTNFYIKTTLLN